MGFTRSGVLKLKSRVGAIAQLKLISRSLREPFEALRQVVWNLGLISLGSLVVAAAINGILIPNGFLSAGLMGLILLIKYSLPTSQVSVLYFLLNVPLFALGYKIVGRRFFLYSIAGMLIFSITLEWVHITINIQDRILAALFAGIITGVGSGIILKSMGSAGGLDILSVMLLKRFSIQLGTTILACNSIVLALGGLLVSVESALYALIYVFVTSYVLNIVITGLSQRKAVMIISQSHGEISQKITEEMHRGLTVFQGFGGFTGQEEKILYTVVTMRELPHLKRLVNKVDPSAFVVVYNTLEVMGNRIGNQPHW
jgi:uncharacterized membrane-anchored protein YitT (DUF2179 family)